MLLWGEARQFRPDDCLKEGCDLCAYLGQEANACIIKRDFDRSAAAEAERQATVRYGWAVRCASIEACGNQWATPHTKALWYLLVDC
jgi:hypothetical protein